MSSIAHAWAADRPRARDILRWPLPELAWRERLLLRAVSLAARGQITSLVGLEHVAPARDPFILALNHSTRREAVLLPAALFLARGGRVIHFLADWNFRLIPGVGLIYRGAQVLTVARKPARPRFLDVLRPLYRDRDDALTRARAALAAGFSVGFFPEGTVNRDPRRLLPGRRGAARLSLETGLPVVPVGIRFPGVAPDAPIPHRAAMAITIGAPLVPVRARNPAPLSEVRAWHAVIMGEVGRLSGKTWNPPLLQIGERQCVKTSA